MNFQLRNLNPLLLAREPSMALLIRWNAHGRLPTDSPLGLTRKRRYLSPPPQQNLATAPLFPAVPRLVANPNLPFAPLCRAQFDGDEKFPMEAPPATAEEPRNRRVAFQVSLWLLTGVYVFWVFLLPYAPGDPVWAIKLDTIMMLLDLSLNFFYILPFANWCKWFLKSVGLHFLESPAVHPTSEALFNVVMGWSVMFAPLLFTDKRRNRYKGSLVILWGVQMFLTNTVLIPYMAIRLNQEGIRQQQSLESKSVKIDFSGVREVMTSGARILGVVCGTVGLISVFWFFLGRPDEGFGNLSDRWTFFLEYLASDRVGYAFVWDICLYCLFQPWLIGANLSNVEKGKAEVVEVIKYVPYLGLVAYLWGLASSDNS